MICDNNPDISFQPYLKCPNGFKYEKKSLSFEKIAIPTLLDGRPDNDSGQD